MTVRQRAKADGEREGLTLIEVTLALAIGAILAIAVFGLFRVGYALQRRTAQGVAVGDAVLGLELIVRTLREASHDPSLLKLWSADTAQDRYDAVAVRSARLGSRNFAVSSEGQPSWNGWVGFIHDAGRQAVREVRFLGVEDVPAPPWKEGRIVAREVRAFTIERDGDRFTAGKGIVLFDSSFSVQAGVWDLADRESSLDPKEVLGE